MGKHDRLDETFSALADGTRRAMLDRLSHGEATVMELVGMFKMSQPGVTKHVKVLERAGLVKRWKDGRRRLCMLEADRLAEVTVWLEEFRRFWGEEYEGLMDLLEEMKRRGRRGRKRGDER